MFKSIKITIAVAVLALAGCSTTTSGFDNVLYNNVIDLQMTNVAANDVCDSGALRVGTVVRDLRLRTEALVKYTTHSSKDANPLIKEVHKLYSDMATAYTVGTPTVGYCKTKLTATYKLLDQVVESIGKKQK